MGNLGATRPLRPATLFLRSSVSLTNQRRHFAGIGRPPTFQAADNALGIEIGLDDRGFPFAKISAC
jgi:hypothetical protein